MLAVRLERMRGLSRLDRICWCAFVFVHVCVCMRWIYGFSYVCMGVSLALLMMVCDVADQSRNAGSIKHEATFIASGWRSEAEVKS